MSLKIPDIPTYESRYGRHVQHDDHVRRWRWLSEVARAGTEDDDFDEAAFKQLERPWW